MLTLMLTLALAAHANDTVMGGSGAAIYPAESTSVRLVRESVTYTEVGDRFAVTADLHFRNDTDQAVTVSLGFPAESYREESDTDSFVADLLILADGQPVPVTLTKVDGKDAFDWWWTAVYTFALTFPAHADVQVLHEYTVRADGDSSGGMALRYIFLTGKGWAGHIDDAVFTWRFARPPIHLRARYGDSPDIPPAVATQRYVAGPIPTLSLHFHDVEPSSNLEVRWDSWAGGALPVRSEEMNVYMCRMELGRFHAALGGFAGWDALRNAELLKCYEPDLLRNFLFAARGFAFTRPEYQAMFEGMFPASAVPFDPAWLTPQESRAIDELKKLP